MATNTLKYKHRRIYPAKEIAEPIRHNPVVNLDEDQTYSLTYEGLEKARGALFNKIREAREQRAQYNIIFVNSFKKSSLFASK